MKAKEIVIKLTEEEAKYVYRAIAIKSLEYEKDGNKYVSDVLLNAMGKFDVKSLE